MAALSLSAAFIDHVSEMENGQPPPNDFNDILNKLNEINQMLTGKWKKENGDQDEKLNEILEKYENAAIVDELGRLHKNAKALELFEQTVEKIEEKCEKLLSIC